VNDPINIKTKKIIPQSSNVKFDKGAVLENLEKNILTNWNTWGKFQQAWTNTAYKTFKDLDKYIVVMYLLGKYWENLSSKFFYQSLDEFYDQKTVVIPKINLIEISTKLNIPKETIRRKVNELQKQNILIREGKSIIFNKYGIDFQKPKETIDLLSSFIEKKTKMLGNIEGFGEPLTKEQIKNFIKKYFTVVWLRYFKLQIPFLIRHRTAFSDLETWIVWGNIALNHQYHLHKISENALLKEDIKISSYFRSVTDVKVDRGINASSISEISGIPRATVIRKLKWLVNNEAIKRNKNLEYQMKSKGKLNKILDENFVLNQEYVAEFLTDILDYIKNSNFKI